MPRGERSKEVTLAMLNDYGPRDFEAWIEGRLVDLRAGTGVEKRRAADLSDFGIEYYDSFLDGLQLLFRKLKPSAKAAFRKGLGALFRNARPAEFPAEAMKDVIMLMGLVEVQEETMAFEPVLGGGRWGELVPELFTLALGVLKSITPARDAYDAARRLLTCANFPPAYVFDAYEVLVECQPKGWDQDFEKLTDRMIYVENQVRDSSNRNYERVLDERYRELADLLLDKVPLVTFAAGLARMTHDIKNLTPHHPVGRVIKCLALGVPTGGIRLARHLSSRQLWLSETGATVKLTELSDAGQLYLDNLLRAPSINDPRPRLDARTFVESLVRRRPVKPAVRRLMRRVRAQQVTQELAQLGR